MFFVYWYGYCNHIFTWDWMIWLQKWVLTGKYTCTFQLRAPRLWEVATRGHHTATATAAATTARESQLGLECSIVPANASSRAVSCAFKRKTEQVSKHVTTKGMPREHRLKRGSMSNHGKHLLFNDGHLLRRSVASAHVLRFRGARRKAGGKALTFADDQCFCLFIAAHIANVTRKPHDP